VELERIRTPVREALDMGAVVSVDTRKPRVAEWALNEGAHMINDVTGLASEGMREVVADHGAACVIMHMKGTPETMQVSPTYDDVVGEVLSFLRTSLNQALDSGISRDSILIDPGIGFGKTLQHNLILLRHLRTFRCLGQPVLVGVSRKSFIGSILDLPPEQRLEGTLAANVAAILNGASALRVHDVQAARRAAAVAKAIRDAPVLPD
jgi:dihydropteroate synthase